MNDQRVRSIIADHFHLPLDRICDEAEFVALGADSLDMVSLTMRLEEDLEIHIPDEQVEECRTVADALAMIRTCRTPA